MRDKSPSDSPGPRRRQREDIKDEVYRQMFRLEEHRPGAARDLAIALLRAWIAQDSGPKAEGAKQWLRKIGPICLAMMEAANLEAEGGRHCAQHQA